MKMHVFHFGRKAPGRAGVFSLFALAATLMIGLLLIPLSLLYGDVQRILSIGIGLWFFVTPVIYPKPAA